MGLLDGQVIGSTLVIDHGPVSKRFNLVIISEGFQISELGNFESLTQEFIDFLFTSSPFDELKCAFNIFRINVSSTDSGVDDPASCGGDGAIKATRFDASFCTGGIRRLLCVDTLAVMDVVESIIPEWHQILVIVNSSVYGGSGGSVAVTSTGMNWKKVALHEMGHVLFGLADEYPYWQGCGIDTSRNSYTGAEPIYPNITTITDRHTIKWKDLIRSDTSLPTTINSDCNNCDTQPDPFPPGTVGAYEGAGYYHCGLYRPEYNCMMKNLSSFCVVCSKEITRTLSVFLDDFYAPVFKPVPVLLALVLKLFLLITLMILTLISPLSVKIKCLIKKILFIIHNCTKGNANPCNSI